MSAYTVDVSGSPGERNELGDLEHPNAFRGGSSSNYRVLNASHAHLVSLVTTPSSPLSDVIRAITTLQAPHNRISSLSGIDAFVCLEVLNLSHNELHVVDAQGATLLRRLPQLQVIDLSHNKLKLVDFETPLSSSKNSASFRKDVPLALTSLNLSHNSFIELPDLRSMPTLQILNLDYNAIDDISDLDNKLPLVSLHTVQLRCNKIGHVSSLVALTALANTLRHVQLYGNTFTLAEDDVQVAKSPGRSRRDSVTIAATHNPWWWRPYVLWLSPLLQTLDLVGFTPSERQAAMHLFRERESISKNLIELLNPQRRDDLEAYLRRLCDRATPPAELYDIVEATTDEAALNESVTSRRTQDEAAGQTYRSSLEKPNGRADSVRSSKANTTTHNTPSVKVAPVASSYHHDAVVAGSAHAATLSAVVKALQGKVKTLQDTVQVMWQHDMSRRTHAAIVIQKYMRSALARKRLNEEESESFRFIRMQLKHLSSPLYIAQSTVAASMRRMNPSVGSSPATAREETPTRLVTSDDMVAVPPASSSTAAAANNSSADIQEVLFTMRGLQGVIMDMYKDLDQYRAMSEREQRRAAIAIQRHYRGYLARRDTKPLRSGYAEYVETLVPILIGIQRAGRGFMARRLLESEHRHRLEVRQLRHKVHNLSAEMAEMKAMLASLTRARSDDPLQAMENIISKYDQRRGEREYSPEAQADGPSKRIVKQRRRPSDNSVSSQSQPISPPKDQ